MLLEFRKKYITIKWGHGEKIASYRKSDYEFKKQIMPGFFYKINLIINILFNLIIYLIMNMVNNLILLISIMGHLK